MKTLRTLLFSAAFFAGGLTPVFSENLEGSLALGKNLEIYLLPQAGIFNRLFSALGLASPPKPVSLTEAAMLGRDDVLFAKKETEEWSIFARVRPSEGEVVWYEIGKPTTKFWKIKLRDGVTISRVKQSASQRFEGSVEGDPWLLRVDAPKKLAHEDEVTPKLVGIQFWLDEFVFQYDETAHYTGKASEKPDNYSILRDAIVTALPDDLDEYSADPEPFERYKQLRLALKRAHPDDLIPLRDLLEAKVDRLNTIPEDDPDARKKAKDLYGELLADLRKRTSDG